VPPLFPELPHSYPDPYPYLYTDTNPNPYSDLYTDTNPNPYSDHYPNPDTYPDPSDLYHSL